MLLQGSSGIAIAILAVMSGGETESESAHPARLVEGFPTAKLGEPQATRWLAGKQLFEQEFDERTGLGPASNGPSCATCHHSPAIGGAGGLEFNVGGDAGDGSAPLFSYSLRGRRSGADDGPTPDESRNAFAQLPLESRKRILAKMSPAVQACSGLEGLDVEQVPRAVGMQTPSLFGLGWLETVHETEILSREDPGDRDGDGVRGIASRVDVGGGRIEVGRFGWRAQAPRMEDFVRGACGGELGLTVPFDERGFGQTEDDDGSADPELAFHQLADLVSYCSDLAPPPRAGRASRSEVVKGEVHFAEVGCATCHVPRLEGEYGPVAAYTDLLLHVVADPPSEPRTEVARGRRGIVAEVAAAEPVAFRTPPLWGISRTGPYLHDGAAETLEQAIEAHAGEARRARRAWTGLDAEQRAELIAFLADL